MWTRLAPGVPAQAVVFYTHLEKEDSGNLGSGSAVAVFDKDGTALRKLWSVECYGAYTGFFPDAGVYDINHSGRPKIVVDCQGTTVCPNFFGVFEYKNGAIQTVPADFEPLKTC